MENRAVMRNWYSFMLAVGFLLSGWAVAMAHHGGLGIEGDLVQWALKVDQWQDEVNDRGYRIKFLSYPRQPVLGNRTRVVFEIQSVASGRYVSGLTARLTIQAPDGTKQTVPLPETTGVTAYYETVVTFERVGEHTVTFHTATAAGPVQGNFRKTVSRSAFMGDWPTFVGYLVVSLAAVVTWIGLVLSVQRRFLAAKQPAQHA